MQGHRIEFCRNFSCRENGFDFGPEEEAISVVRIEKRFLPDTIARQEHAPAAAVPNGEGKHPAQLLDDVVAPLFIAVQDNFGICFRMELMPRSEQLTSEFEKIVNLAVENDPHGPVLVRHGLVACGGKIDYGESPMTQRHPLR